MKFKNPLNLTYLGEKKMEEIQYEGYVKQVSNRKHLASIKEFILPKMRDKMTNEHPYRMVGIDLETKENQVKVFGSFEKKYAYKIRKDGSREEAKEMLRFFAGIVHEVAYTKNMVLASWSEYDATHIFKLFLEANELSENEKARSFAMYSSGEGKFDQSIMDWETPPVIGLKLNVKRKQTKENGKPICTFTPIEFGILQVLNSSVTFYVIDRNQTPRYQFRMVTMYNIAKLELENLETVCETYGIPYEKMPQAYKEKRLQELMKLKKYQKMTAYELDRFIEGELHGFIDWNRFDTEMDYQVEILKSNRMDCQAVQQVGLAIQEHYSDMFMWWTFDEETLKYHRNLKRYPKNLYSTGSLGVFALAMSMKDEARMRLNIYNQAEEWIKKGYTQQEVIKLINRSVESYMGGKIEAYMFGNGEKEEIWESDMASAYPFAVSNLLDLKDSRINFPKDKEDAKKPPRLNGTNYVIATAKVDIKNKTTINPIGLKEPEHEAKTIYPTDDYIQTSLLENFLFLEEQGEPVEYLDWVEIQTNGELHPVAYMMKDLFKKRMSAKTDAEQKIVKTVMSSIYGKMFEATPHYNIKKDEELQHFFLQFEYFKAGQLFHPLYASIVVNHAKLRLCEMMKEAQKKGGKLINAMTDSFAWVGTKEMLPKNEDFTSILCKYDRPTNLQNNGWTTEKLLGTWSEPKRCLNFIQLNIGMYQFQYEDGTAKHKAMGFNIPLKKDGTVKPFKELLKESIKNDYRKKSGYNKGKECIKLKTKTFWSVQKCLSEMDFDQLGLIEDEREEEIVIVDVFPKRLPKNSPYHRLNHKAMLDRLIETDPISTRYYKGGQSDLFTIDGTMSYYREEIENKGYVLMEEPKSIKVKHSKQKSGAKRQAELKAYQLFLELPSMNKLNQLKDSLGGTMEDLRTYMEEVHHYTWKEEE